mmetsp:Transcript_17593/g.24713  ORF Transcript_17593/g.24713 Transcript_17593/m.24713 type:complete len:150 (+) Transcript_17593:176-625(+)
MSFWRDDWNDAPESATRPRPPPKPTHFDNAADVHKFYPKIQRMAQTKKPGGQNVMRRAAADAVAAKNDSDQRAAAQMKALSLWHQGQEKFSHQAESKRTETLVKAELTQAQKEVKVMRRERLRLLLESEHEGYINELQERGMAIVAEDF